MPKPTQFESLSDALATAGYVEQLLGAEHQWITNRLSWLFVSQSFCITAYTILVTSTGARFVSDRSIAILKVGLPLLGIVCSVMVGIAVAAAASVSRGLADERARIARYINENCPAVIPLVGARADLREKSWTYWCGALPHWFLPWVLGFFWLALLVG